MKEFFAMSGYATYVWWSYGIGIAVLLLNVYWSRAALQRAEAEVRRRMATEEQGS
jgi:heme exporter protein D